MQETRNVRQQSARAVNDKGAVEVVFRRHEKGRFQLFNFIIQCCILSLLRRCKPSESKCCAEKSWKPCRNQPIPKTRLPPKFKSATELSIRSICPLWKTVNWRFETSKSRFLISEIPSSLILTRFSSAGQSIFDISKVVFSISLWFWSYMWITVRTPPTMPSARHPKASGAL